MRLGIVIILIIFSVSAVVGGFCWPYVVNSWLVYFGKDPVLVYWQGAVIGLVPGLGQFSLPAVVITWIAMLFIL